MTGARGKALRGLAPRTGPVREGVVDVRSLGPVGPDAERELLLRARALDPDAWETVYRRSYAVFTGYARRRLPTGHDVDDVVSEALARAMDRVHVLEDHGHRLEAWVFGFLRNVVREQQRSGNRTISLRDDEEIHSDEPGPLDRVLGDEQEASLRTAFAALAEEDQEVLWLRLVAGLSAAEVAEVVGRREGAVRMAQSRALERLRRRLEEVHP